MKLLEALEIRTLSPLYLHSAEIQRSDHWLPSVECPVLILHAADDVKVNHAKRSLCFIIWNDKRHIKFDIFFMESIQMDRKRILDRKSRKKISGT